MASKITIPDLKKIRVTDPLFSHYAGMVAKKMIPVQWEILNGKQGQSRCFCIDNFRIAGGTLQGEHRGVVFGDTDAYKWLEAVAYCANNGETEYIPQADELIEIIGQAQQPDGYLNTYFTVCHPDGFTCPILPRSSVGIRSLPIFAKAVPHLPRESSSL